MLRLSQFRVSRLAALAAPAFLLADPGAATGQLSETHTLTADAAAVYNLVGEVRVLPSRGSRIEVSVVRAGRDAADLQVERSREGEWEAVRVLYPDDRIVFAPFGRASRAQWTTSETGGFRDLVPRGSRQITIVGSGRGLSAHADITVHLPPGKRLQVHQAAGRVELENVEGDIGVTVRAGSVRGTRIDGPLRVEGRSGSVRLDGVRGDLRVDTRSGSIQARGIRGERLQLAARSGSIEASDVSFAQADLSARSGRIRVEGAQGGRLAMETRSGRIQADDVEAGEVTLVSRSGGAAVRGLAAGALRAESRSGSLELDLVRQTASGRVVTRSGRVTLQVPRGFAAELDLESRGRIQVDAPASAVDQTRDRFRGRLGDGGTPFEVRARSGAIRVREG